MSHAAAPRRPHAVFVLVALVLSVALGLSAQTVAADDNATLQARAIAVARQSFATADVYDRLLAAGALADLGEGDALEFLKTYLAHEDLVYKRATIDTLLAGTHPAELDLLYRTATETPSVLGLMMESLAATPRPEMQDLISEALREGSLYVRKSALQAVARGRVEGLSDQLNDVIADPATHETLRAYAYYALVSTGDADAAIGDRLIALSGSSQVEEREVAAIGMGLMPAARTGKRLQTLMTDRSDERTALAALASAAGQGNDEAIGRLIKGVAYGKPLESAALAGALKRLPPKTAAGITKVLMTCCKLSADAATRVLESWSTIDANPAALYSWGLAHEEPDVKLQTVWLIGHRKDASALALLGPLLDDSDVALRTMAAWSVLQCTANAG